MHRAGVPLEKRAYGPRDVKKLQRWLNQHSNGRYRIVVFDFDAGGQVVFKGANSEAPKRINILLYGKHFEPISNPNEIFKVNFKKKKKKNSQFFRQFFKLTKIFFTTILSETW